MFDFLSADFLSAVVVIVILIKLLNSNKPKLKNVKDYEPIIEERKTIMFNKFTSQNKLIGHNSNVKHTDFSFWLGQDKMTILILCVCSLAMLFLHIYVTYNHSSPYPTGRPMARLFLKNNKYNKTPSFVIEIMEKIKKNTETIEKWNKK